MNIPRTLTIAGSDSGGGAGIQADLKTFSALGCYGMSVITALTAQNTQEVRAIHGVPASFIRAQMDAVCDDIGVDAVKIGMLHSSEVIHAVAGGLDSHRLDNIILDTVMVAKSGDHLLQDEAVSALRETLIPMSTLITPNLPEVEVLLGRPVTRPEEMEEAGKELLKMGPPAVLVKGGHLNQGDTSPDCLVYRPHYDEAGYNDSGNSSSESSGTAEPEIRIRWYEMPRIETRNNHGTGCTLSSAIAAGMARRLSLEDAVEQALNYLNTALRAASGWKIGGGHGPVHHFHKWW